MANEVFERLQALTTEIQARREAIATCHAYLNATNPLIGMTQTAEGRQTVQRNSQAWLLAKQREESALAQLLSAKQNLSLQLRSFQEEDRRNDERHRLHRA